MKRSTTHTPRRAGFTLMEVIVTILIMGGIMVTITQILNAARNSRDRIHNMQEAHLAGPALLDRIERDLRALDVFNREVGQTIRITNRVIQGLDADSIDFVATTNGLVIQKQAAEDRYVRADTNEVGFRLRANPNYDDFLELWRREDFGVDEEPFDDGSYSFLHDRVKGFNIEVFEEDGPDADPLESWGADTDDFNGLPARIEIELKIELAPRLIRETLIQTKREVTYRRVYRFPETLRLAQELQPIQRIPNIPSPTPELNEGGAAGAAGAAGGGAGSPFGGLGGGGGGAGSSGGGGGGGGAAGGFGGALGGG
ncbi:MAG: prepilin-type N-terminal cleavage/methylation domain-containing protein [Planctomycetota bacterium]